MQTKKSHWPSLLILIVLGLSGMVQGDGCCQHGGRIGSGLLALWGALLLAQTFGYLAWGQIWPIVLIAIGVALLVGSFHNRALPSAPSGPVDASSLFSGIVKDVTQRDFRSGSARAVFGNVQYDFTQADLAEDRGYLDVDIVFGAVEVRIPIGWSVAIETAVVFGAAENKTRVAMPGAASKTLVIRGRVVFGSIEVKN